MDLPAGFTLLRRLGHDSAGGLLRFDALVGIHWIHRLVAVPALAALAWLAAQLWADGSADARRFARWLIALLAWQAASGLSNVVLGWPIVAALAHSAGAAALVATLVTLWARLRLGLRVGASAPGPTPSPTRAPAGRPARAV